MPSSLHPFILPARCVCLLGPLFLWVFAFSGYHAEDVFFSRAVRLLNAKANARAPAPGSASGLAPGLAPGRAAADAAAAVAVADAAAVVGAHRSNFTLALLMQMVALGKQLPEPYARLQRMQPAAAAGNEDGAPPAASAVAAAPASALGATAALEPVRRAGHLMPSVASVAAALAIHPRGLRLSPYLFDSDR